MFKTKICDAVSGSIKPCRASSPLLGLLAGALMIQSSMSVQAQTADKPSVSAEIEIEEIVVKGIRDSLISAASIKRNAAGVVDAITAKDIADFPDANLAESLQRVTGVSIDRQDNEGNQISVRGLGPSFNLVTLNGRQMPVASSPDVETLNSATQSRAFNFAEIASESVSSVNVFKTGRADLPSGGIGATVDIRTARPFDFDETELVYSVAGVADFSNEDGSSVTPEIGGFFTHKFNDNFGILLTGSFSERDFRNELNTLESFDVTTPTEFISVDGPGTFEQLVQQFNLPAGTDAIFTPRTFITEVSENQRTRTNGQAVIQWAANENLTITADYTASRFELDEQRQESAIFNLIGATAGSLLDFNITPNGTVSSQTRNGIAIDAIATDNELRIENDSFGLNAKWENESFTLEVDAHSSSSISQPDEESNDTVAIFQGALNNVVTFNLDPNGGQPTLIIDDSATFRGEEQFGGGAPLPNVTFAQDPDAFSPLGSIGRVLQIENDVNQIQFKGSWLNQSNGSLASIDFGVGFIEYDVSTRFSDFPFLFQGLVPCTGICEADFFNTISTSSFGGILPFINTFSASDAINNVFTEPSNFPQLGDINIEEQSFSVYLNSNWVGEFNGLETRLSAGLRVETTDVTSSSEISVPSEIIVTSLSEATVNSSTQTIFTQETGDYTNFLPAIDFSILPTDKTVVRFSYGRTIARPDLNALRPGLQIADVRPGGPFNANIGNTDLDPFESDNFDAAFEWYYNDASFFAATFFFKSVSNFIGTSTAEQTVNDINSNPLTDPSSRLEIDLITGASVPVISQATDPVALFDVTQTVNANDADITGLELAVQHVFGDTGFGIQANLTFVDSDVEFDPFALDQVEQALIGLSDTANLVGFFENDKFQVRLAANWRDEFLFATNQLRVQNEPVFFDTFVQVDASASYKFNEKFSVFFEALNITGEGQEQRGRFSDQFISNIEQEPRITIGIRGKL